MNKFFKIVSVVLCLALALSLCACGGNGGTKGKISAIASDDKSQHVNLKWYISVSEPKGFAEVMDAANKYLGDKLNVTLNLVCVEPGDYDSKIQLALAANEEFDIVWTSNWKNKYEPNVSKGAYLALDDYLKLPELKKLKDYYSDGIWKAATVGDKIYGVPMNQVLYNQAGVSFIKDVSEKYGVVDAIRNLSSMDELEEVYQTVRDGQPADFCITTGSNVNYFVPYYTNVNSYSIVDGKVSDMYDRGFETAKRMRRWNEKNFFPADIATLDDTTSLIKQAKVYSNYNRYLPGVEGKFRISKGYDVLIQAVSEPVLDRGGVQSTLNAISSTSKHPVRALKLIDLMLNDEYMLNLICYGIEGRDYKKDPDNPKRMIRESGAYYISEFMIGSQFLAYLVPSYEDGVWEETIKANNAAKVDENIGFSFDPTPVQSEIAQCSSVNAEYNKILGFGLDDPEVVYPEREQKLQLAGKQTVMDEVQRQYDAWKAQQK